MPGHLPIIRFIRSLGPDSPPLTVGRIAQAIIETNDKLLSMPEDQRQEVLRRMNDELKKIVAPVSRETVAMNDRIVAMSERLAQRRIAPLIDAYKRLIAGGTFWEFYFIARMLRALQPSCSSEEPNIHLYARPRPHDIALFIDQDYHPESVDPLKCHDIDFEIDDETFTIKSWRSRSSIPAEIREVLDALIGRSILSHHLDPQKAEEILLKAWESSRQKDDLLRPITPAI